MATQDKDINQLKTDVAVIKATQITYVSDFKEFKIEVKDNQKTIMDTMEQFAFTPLSDFTTLKKAHEDLKSDVENNYRKKSDGQNARNMAYTVGAAVIVIVISAFVNFVISGGLRSVQ